jgi:hypothetical protein
MPAQLARKRWSNAVEANGAGVLFLQERAFPQETAVFCVVSGRVPQRPGGGFVGPITSAVSAGVDPASRWAVACCTSVSSKKASPPGVHSGKGNGAHGLREGIRELVIERDRKEPALFPRVDRAFPG